ncbi:MAG: GNAT family N-acetyltransferase [Sulfuricurvum sp.]|nr:GNAT family N-acetyltransferase [Sulfuricurvum sp.]
MHTHISQLTRDEYITSINSISDSESRRFANQSLAWWDRHFSWKAQACDVLVGEDESHLCYIFSKTDQYGQYLSVYNLFTPLSQQRNGYAHELLRLIIQRALSKHVRRINFCSVPDALDFYIALGFMFWGINDIGDYYCDLPIPKEGLEGFDNMINTLNLKSLIGEKVEKIYAKIHNNEIKLTQKQLIRYTHDRIKLEQKYTFNALFEFRQSI